jgi:chitin disaccharide deacetylase
MGASYRLGNLSHRDRVLQEVGASRQDVQLKTADLEQVFADEAPRQSRVARKAAALIINADDWGRDTQTTDSILECVLHGSVSSASAMVFMEDSERAAAIARERGIDTGLHLNLTTPFSAASCPRELKEHQQKTAKYLCGFSFARAIYHPWLATSFEYAVKTQIEEYSRLYGAEPKRFDGHHHMHLSANVLLGNLLPRGASVRRHFSHESGEKPLRNALFRKFTDELLTRDHPLVDFFFALPPLEPAGRLQCIFSLAQRFVVEVETHPVNLDEYSFLTSGELFHRAAGLPLGSWFTVAPGVVSSVPANVLHPSKHCSSISS